MSLDVYLISREKRLPAGSGILIREKGCTREISEEEWRERNPGQMPVRVTNIEETNTVYWANITHNLSRMAEEAGIYEVLWRPEEIGISKATQLIEPLRVGVQLMKADPPRFEKHNAKNGWGLYEDFVPFVENYLNACIDNPDADVSVSR